MANALQCMDRRCRAHRVKEVCGTARRQLQYAVSKLYGFWEASAHQDKEGLACDWSATRVAAAAGKYAGCTSHGCAPQQAHALRKRTHQRLNTFPSNPVASQTLRSLFFFHLSLCEFYRGASM
jgi:hypothetical protein